MNMGSQLRTRLRNLNTEYSALVRDVNADDRAGRLENLRKQRQILLKLMAADGSRLRIVRGMGTAGGSGLGIEAMLPRANNGMSA